MRCGRAACAPARQPHPHTPHTRPPTHPPLACSPTTQATIKIWDPLKRKAVSSLGAWAAQLGLPLPGYVRQGSPVDADAADGTDEEGACQGSGSSGSRCPGQRQPTPEQAAALRQLQALRGQALPTRRGAPLARDAPPPAKRPRPGSPPPSDRHLQQHEQHEQPGGGDVPGWPCAAPRPGHLHRLRALDADDRSAATTAASPHGWRAAPRRQAAPRAPGAALPGGGGAPPGYLRLDANLLLDGRALARLAAELGGWRKVGRSGALGCRCWAGGRGAAVAAAEAEAAVGCRSGGQ